MFDPSTLLWTLSLLHAALASPLSLGLFPTTSTETPTALSQETVDTEFLRPALFSRVAYCSSAAVTSWECGAPCESMGGGIEVLQAGGDDGLIPMYFVAHDSATESIVVTHQGTDRKNILSILNDVQLQLVKLNSTRFPGADEDIRVHEGFQKTFERTADSVLGGVQAALASKGVNKVLVTGHSLGAAMALMDALMLKQNLDPSVEIKATLFGLPRAGNAAWADFVDATLGDTMTRVSNQNDPVPTLPPRFLGYQHPAREVHIRAVGADGEATDTVACEGQENENCSLGNSVFDINIADHSGESGIPIPPFPFPFPSPT
ncbi:hypothetical protein D9615_006564 [Tricholomella constricta]|uniref:Fungal lipase-type domain-containing protein n=1 Tax=Tricholomella constricta TaxID=117010 RepID=A0A8H5M3L0_9AGAR|nr:hypothetical protein D9615_006564 [Tricholomella constricta]